MTQAAAPAFHLPDIPKAFKPYLRIGTCSWKYDSWKGLVYDRGKTYRPGDYLADYARHFNSVEVDQWFWSLFPGGVRLPEAADGQANTPQAVPDDFVFTVKAPNALTLTHFYKKETARHGEFAGRPNDSFLERRAARALPRISGSVRQEIRADHVPVRVPEQAEDAVPRGLHSSASATSSPLRPRGLPMPSRSATRTTSFPISSISSALHGCGFVYLDGYYMPPIGAVFAKHKPRTAPFQVVRLHGGDRGEIEKETGEVWDRIVAPKPAAVDAAVEITVENIRKKITTTINVNNHFEGSAPLTAAAFLEKLSEF